MIRTPALTSALLVALLILAPASASAGGPACLGFSASDLSAMGYNVIVGTDGNNRINGTWRADALIGLGGNDTLNGAGGDDVLCGGDGDDTLNGGTGINVLLGGYGADLLQGGPRRDDMIGGDVIDGGAAAVPPDPVRPPGWYEGVAPHLPDPRGGRIYLFGRVFDCAPGDGDDRLYEAAGGGGEELNVAPRLYGCGGADLLDGGDGDEYMFGGDGDDTIIGGPGNDWLDGQDGVDACDGGLHQGTVSADGVWRTIDAAFNCETVQGVP